MPAGLTLAARGLLLAGLARAASSAAGSKTYDSNGCCLSCGEYFCKSKGQCVGEWKLCDPGVGSVKDCTYTWAGLSWDLTPLKAHNPYVIQDIFSNPTQNWSYVVGFCEDVPASEATTSARCASTTGSAGEVMTATSPAYQLLDTTWNYESCYRLGDSIDGLSKSADEATVVEFGLYDIMNPAEGFYMHYKGGNACKDSVSEKAACTDEINGKTYCRRSIKLNFMCNNEVSEVPSFEEIEEARGCQYEVTFNSVYGCPRECPTHNGLVCGQRGLCFYDGFEDGLTADGRSGSAQCLCEDPFGGSGCSLVVEEPPAQSWMFWAGVLMVISGMALMLGAKRSYLIALISGLLNLLRGNSRHDVRYTKVPYYQDDEPKTVEVARAWSSAYSKGQLAMDADPNDEINSFSL